jgi:hypothetical protein
MPKRDSIDVKEEVVVNPVRMNRSGFVFDIFAPISYVNICINRVLGRSVFPPLERTLLRELISRLPDEVRIVVETQISEVNCTNTMHYGSKSETILHKMRPFGVMLKSSRMFNFQSEEVILATTKFKCKGKRYTVDFLVVLNVLSMLVYNRSTKEIAEESEIAIVDFDLDTVAVDVFGRAIDT